MSYEEAIMNAIIQLHDHLDIGSSIASIKNHMKEHFIKEQFRSIYHNSYNSYLQFNLKSSLFLVALKSLVDKKVIVPHTFCSHMSSTSNPPSSSSSSSPPSSSFSSFLTSSSCYTFKLSNEYKIKLTKLYQRYRSKADKESLIKTRNNKLKKRMLQHIKQYQNTSPAVRIKPSLSKLKFIDQNAGIIVDKHDIHTNNNKQLQQQWQPYYQEQEEPSGMDWDEETKRRYTTLIKLGLNLNTSLGNRSFYNTNKADSMFIIARKKKTLYDKKHIHHNKIVVKGNL